MKKLIDKLVLDDCLMTTGQSFLVDKFTSTLAFRSFKLCVTFSRCTLKVFFPRSAKEPRFETTIESAFKNGQTLLFSGSTLERLMDHSEVFTASLADGSCASVCIC